MILVWGVKIYNRDFVIEYLNLKIIEKKFWIKKNFSKMIKRKWVIVDNECNNYN